MSEHVQPDELTAMRAGPERPVAEGDEEPER